MTVEELETGDVEAMFETMKSVLWALLKAHGVDVEKIDINQFEVREIIDDGEGAGSRPVCWTVDQNGNKVLKPC